VKDTTGIRVAMWISVNVTIGIAVCVTGTAWPLFALLIPLLADLSMKDIQGKQK